jgi:hypothetical protein
VKRVVTDILSFGDAPVAFDEITHGEYRGVCPWCENSLTTVRAKTFGELYELLFDLMQVHVRTCKKKHLTEVQVTIRRPLSNRQA